MFPALAEGDPRNSEAFGTYRYAPPAAAPTAVAVVGRVDGVFLRDAVRVQAWSDLPDALVSAAQAGETVTIEDVDVAVFPGEPAQLVAVLPGSPAITVTGRDPIGFVVSTGIEAMRASLDAGGASVDLSIDPLPDGYEYVVGPAPEESPVLSASLVVPDGVTGDGAGIEVRPRSPLIELAPLGDLESTEVGGRPGWLLPAAGFSVVWQVDDGTWARIAGSNDAGVHLAIAGGVVFVDEVAWRDRYQVPEPAFGPPLGD